MSQTEYALPPSIEVVCFDWDGTVVDSVGPKLLQNQAIAAEFGNNLTLEEVRGVWNQASGFPDLMHRLTGTDNMDAIMPIVRRDYDNPLYAKRPLEFANDAIKRVRALGRRTALVTNLTTELLTADANRVGIDLDKLFDYWQTVDS